MNEYDTASPYLAPDPETYYGLYKDEEYWREIEARRYAEMDAGDDWHDEQIAYWQ